MHASKICRNISTPLLVIVLLVAIIFVVNTKNWTVVTGQAADPDIYKKERTRQWGDSILPCEESTIKAIDTLKVLRFKSRCHVTRMTSLPDGVLTTWNKTSLSRRLSHVAKYPHGNHCICPRVLRLASFYLPRTALLSFPGSGNTWTRHLIQQLTGVYTGSIYLSPRFSRESDVFAFEGSVNRVSVVKTHRPPARNGLMEREYRDGTTLKVRFDKLLIVLRNPFKALVAEFKRSTLSLGKVGNKIIKSNDTRWVDFFDFRSRNWGLFVEGALNTTLPYTIIFYEDLHSCLLPELVKIASFLRHNELDEFSFCCTLKEQEGQFHRPSSKQTPEDIYTVEQRRTMNQILLKTSEDVKNIHPGVAKRILTYMMT